jgi:hypothetical protein
LTTGDGALIVSLGALLVSAYAAIGGHRERQNRIEADGAAELHRAVLALSLACIRKGLALGELGRMDYPQQIEREYDDAELDLQHRMTGIKKRQIRDAVEAFRVATNTAALSSDDRRTETYDAMFTARDRATKLIEEYRKKLA